MQERSPQTWRSLRREMSWWLTGFDIQCTKKYNLAAKEEKNSTFLSGIGKLLNALRPSLDKRGGLYYVLQGRRPLEDSQLQVVQKLARGRCATSTRT